MILWNMFHGSTLKGFGRWGIKGCTIQKSGLHVNFDSHSQKIISAIDCSCFLLYSWKSSMQSVYIVHSLMSIEWVTVNVRLANPPLIQGLAYFLKKFLRSSTLRLGQHGASYAANGTLPPSSQNDRSEKWVPPLHYMLVSFHLGQFLTEPWWGEKVDFIWKCGASGHGWSVGFLVWQQQKLPVACPYGFPERRVFSSY